MYIYIYIHMYINIYTYMHVPICIYIYIYIPEGALRCSVVCYMIVDREMLWHSTVDYGIACYADDMTCYSMS